MCATQRYRWCSWERTNEPSNYWVAPLKPCLRWSTRLIRRRRSPLSTVAAFSIGLHFSTRHCSQTSDQLKSRRFAHLIVYDTRTDWSAAIHGWHQRHPSILRFLWPGVPCGLCRDVRSIFNYFSVFTRFLDAKFTKILGKLGKYFIPSDNLNSLARTEKFTCLQTCFCLDHRISKRLTA